MIRCSHKENEMKKVKLFSAALLIFLVSLSCTNFSLSHFNLYKGFSDPPYPKIWMVDQDCETLELSIEDGAGAYVSVDGEWFPCIKGASDLSCSGPFSSVDPDLLVKVYELKSDEETLSEKRLENQRPWDICDYDGDGAVDAEDSCPEDPEIWVCACDVGDDDSDGDGVPDCNDNCPDDPEKIEPGHCSCGVSDLDTDGDGMADCEDECPLDPVKAEPWLCGCGVAETDTDGDHTPNCIDNCPENPEKTEPGVCGCGLSDLDEDEDGLVLCQDICPGDAWHDEVGDPCIHDEDGDGTLDPEDHCPYDPKKTAPGKCGCGNPINC